MRALDAEHKDEGKVSGKTIRRGRVELSDGGFFTTGTLEAALTAAGTVVSSLFPSLIPSPSRSLFAHLAAFEHHVVLTHYIWVRGRSK